MLTTRHHFDGAGSHTIGARQDRRASGPRRSPEQPEVMQACRFSIDWRAVAPDAAGNLSTAGLDYYDRLVDELLHAGLTPLPTFDYWRTPEPLEVDGGWLTRRTVAAFGAHVRAVVHRLADRVDTWTTLNEPGVHGPHHLDATTRNTVMHHVLVAHGLASTCVRAAAPDAQVAVVLNFCATTSPATDNAAGFAYADAITGIDISSLPDGVSDDDLALITQPIDILGVSCPITGWDHDSDVFIDLVRSLHGRYGFRQLIVVEDGLAMPNDTARRLQQIQAASELGVPIVGYLV